jgi:Peptidase family M28
MLGLQLMAFLSQKTSTCPKIETSLHHTDGGSCLSIAGVAIPSKFKNITNILVKIHTAKNSNQPQQAILINSHFDSALGAIGATDAGALVSVMLEVFRDILNSDSTQFSMEYPLVSLFSFYLFYYIYCYCFFLLLLLLLVLLLLLLVLLLLLLLFTFYFYFYFLLFTFTFYFYFCFYFTVTLLLLFYINVCIFFCIYFINHLHLKIFMFNGAEETGLLGAVGFADTHPWAKEISFVLNMDSAG